MKFNSRDDVTDFLHNIPKFSNEGASAADFNLPRFRAFCESMGNPQSEFESIHIAGTNGKGSTCYILSAIFQQAGYKVGTYTSPHILDYRERFRINGCVIGEEDLVEFFNEYGNQLQRAKLTYFEISTALAFWWFAKSNIDMGIIETGLGGRLDATNVILPRASIITSVGYDHTDILGDTLEQIAREKGGIIKNGVPVIIGDLPQQARQEITNIAQKTQSPVLTIDELNPKCISGGRFQLHTSEGVLNINTRLMAPVQAKNMAIAWQLTQYPGNKFSISKQDFLAALKELQPQMGRFNKLAADKNWYFDGAHNAEAVKSLKQAVNAVGSVQDSTLILSLMRDKCTLKLSKEFSEFKKIYYYQIDLDRAASFDDIKRKIPHVKPFPERCQNQILRCIADSKLVIFAGSFYFYATVRDWISNKALNQ